MKTKLRITLHHFLTLFMSIICAHSLHAQSNETIVIEGVVESSIGVPIINAEVKIMDLGNSGLYDSTVTDNSGFYQLEIETLTDIENSDEIPNSFSLSQNYPNPFTKNTIIGFSTEKEGYAKLEVFNIIGQKVITLFERFLSPNQLAVNWDGRNINGNKVANGIYIYRLTLNDQIISKKMLFNSGTDSLPQITLPTNGTKLHGSHMPSKVNDEFNLQITISHPTIKTIIDTVKTENNFSTYIHDYLAFYGNYAGYPSDVITFYDQWKITLGSGSSKSDLINYEHDDYFYNVNDGMDWVVYKTPNSGGTTPNSSNTRSELRHLPEWTPETGGRLTGTLKVMHVSTTGDARVPATFSVVVGQIHGDEGHKNEPLKIFYKKFPGHTKGSLFWNYEINTEGSNSERWDISTSVWGYDWSVVGETANTYPDEPEEGLELGEEFSYEVNVYEGVMYLTFISDGHETKTFTKNLVQSDYTNYSDIPAQVLTVFAPTGQDGTEKLNAYSNELQYFKQGTYNQTNGKDPNDNMVWNTGAETYGGNLAQQYANGSYAEVWFKKASVGPGELP